MFEYIYDCRRRFTCKKYYVSRILRNVEPWHVDSQYMPSHQYTKAQLFEACSSRLSDDGKEETRTGGDRLTFIAALFFFPRHLRAWHRLICSGFEKVVTRTVDRVEVAMIKYEKVSVLYCRIPL